MSQPKIFIDTAVYPRTGKVGGGERREGGREGERGGRRGEGREREEMMGRGRKRGEREQRKGGVVTIQTGAHTS